MKGFTLIEVILYIGLFAIVMTGGVVGMYSLFESTAHSSERAQLEEEGTYLSNKIDWYLGQSASIQSPTTHSSVLSMTLDIGDTVSIRSNAGALTIETNGTNSDSLSNSNTVVSSLTFIKTTLAGSSVQSISTSFELSATTSDGHVLSQTFVSTRYLNVPL